MAPETQEGMTTAWASGDAAAILASVPSWLRARVGARWLVAGLVGIVAGGWMVLALLQGGGPQVDPVIPLATATVSNDAVPPPDDPASGPPDAPGGIGDDPNGDKSDDVGVITAHVAGAVAQPGVHSLRSGARIADLVAAAGGETPDADLDRVNLAALVPDGARVWVPRRGEAQPPEVLDPVVGFPVPTAGGGGSEASPPGTGGGRISLNRADATELEALPGIGPATAAAIVAHRAQHGPFPSVEALEAVRGIGPSKMEALRDLVET
jgi:competence protein ComEA